MGNKGDEGDRNNLDNADDRAAAGDARERARDVKARAKMNAQRRVLRALRRGQSRAAAAAAAGVAPSTLYRWLKGGAGEAGKGKGRSKGKGGATAGGGTTAGGGGGDGGRFRRRAERAEERARLDQALAAGDALIYELCHPVAARAPVITEEEMRALIPTWGPDWAARLRVDDGTHRYALDEHGMHVWRVPEPKPQPCGARTRKGTPCRARRLPGRTRCRFHGGLSTGPKTAEGKARIAEANRSRAEQQRAREKAAQQTGGEP